MALLYYTNRVDISSKDVLIRPLEDDDYQVAITFPGEDDDENTVTEILLTKEEVQEAYDLLFNR